ncbi:MAG: NAD(+)/NADH kinase [Candidatus Eremiobacteraeota bacterium]|nr:NAD(+)/NADH kinase [Candidatus Eremiobacteraeota bacterium]MBV8460205.1 NAD(+)/NADH kinase [Candidatus Eremiobacteraeota bacterium]MBV8596670.1 NAD(+)/NADH kinase [Candidatus Eremiobacteraeota bacterium]
MTIARISNIALYVDVRRSAAVSAAKAVAEIAASKGVALQIVEQQAAALGLNGARIAGEYPKAADILISLGGDGTLLQAAHLAGPLGIPVLGVDFGRVGFLTEVPRDGYQAALAQILRGGMKIERQLALEVRVAGQDRSYYAVNDVHVDRKHHGHIVSFGIYLSGVHIATIPADGVVVASPTGSTAYFLSAGGPIMSPKLEAFGIAPISPHTLFSRPLIVGADEKVAIVLPPDSHGTELFVDGRPQVELAPGATVEVVRSAHPMQFVRLGGEQFFFQTLERKLHWGVSIKEAIDPEPS